MSTSNKYIKDLVRTEIQALKSYHVADAGNLLKLDAMENPYAWPGELSEAWHKHLSDLSLNRYPAPDAPAVREAIADLVGLDNLDSKSGPYEILLGNGSDEIIQMLAMCLAKPGACIMAPEPSFVMYKMIATFTGMDYQAVPLKDDFDIDEAAFIDAIKQHKPELIFIAQPNNPTGNAFEEQAIRNIIELAPGLVVVDEAYLAFTDSDMLHLISEYDNVVVMRTLSKVGLAGLRCGFLLAQKAWIEEINKVRLPYNINTLTQASVAFALQNYAALKAQTESLKLARRDLISELSGLDAIETFPSEANFVLIRLSSDYAAPEVFSAMKESGVLIKNLHGSHAMLNNCLRLTVGTEQQNRQMLDALAQALS